MISLRYTHPLVLSLCLLFFNCQPPKTTQNDSFMTVKGSIAGLRKGTLYLQKMQDTLLVSVDSTTVNGTPDFLFQTPIETDEVYYLYLNKEDGDSLNDRILFFGEKGEITINTLLKTFESSAKVTGSENQELLQEYRKLARQFDSKNLDYIKAYFEAAKDNSDKKVLD